MPESLDGSYRTIKSNTKDGLELGAVLDLQKFAAFANKLLDFFPPILVNCHGNASYSM
jgi:hypothetical protein